VISGEHRVSVLATLFQLHPEVVKWYGRMLEESGVIEDFDGEVLRLRPEALGRLAAVAQAAYAFQTKLVWPNSFPYRGLLVDPNAARCRCDTSPARASVDGLRTTRLEASGTGSSSASGLSTFVRPR
jgi:hypothetical protein